jgi:hypothetical protein
MPVVQRMETTTNNTKRSSSTISRTLFIATLTWI